MNRRSKMIKYIDIWGLREGKYDWLKNHEVKNTKWQKLSPAEPYYFFVPMEKAGWNLYETFWKVTDVFPVNSVGIVTARDNFVIDFNKSPLETRIRTFRNSADDDNFIKASYNLKDKPTFNWSVKEAREKLRGVVNWEDYFTKILYRPFDERWIYYHPTVIERHRENVMKHMLQPNLALLAKRQAKLDFSYAFVADKIAESCVFESVYANNTVFPLYLYEVTEVVKEKRNPSVSVMMLFDKPRDGGYKVKRPNINIELHALLNNTYNPQPVTTPLGKQKAFDISPEEIFYYIYAVVYSNAYRQKYQEFLKIDFPRVPFTKDYKLFQKLAKLGEQLVELHLLKSKELKKPIAKFQGRNDNLVEKREYKNERVYINDTQYFEGIKLEVWNYQIGGYQVLDKWLKDRKSRVLSAEDIKHYCKVVTALTKTIELQKQIDKSYPKVEQTLI